MKDGWKISAIGIIGIVILESIALLKGINGVMFGSAMGAIGIIVGYNFKKYRRRDKHG